MWRLEFRGGELAKVEEPALRVPPGHIALKVKAFLVDDFTLWSLRRGGRSPSRWAFGVVVANGEVGRYVVAYAENAAAQYAASRLYVYASPDPSSLELVHVAYVVEALNRLPRFRPVEVVGDDPRGSAVRKLAEVGKSKWRVALQGGVVEGGVAVALSRLVEVRGNALVRFVDVPSRRALEAAAKMRLRLGLPVVGLEDLAFDRWAIVKVEGA